MKPNEPHTLSDAEIRSAFRKGALKAPENGWFTPRVMNRLPEKAPRRRCPVPELVCYLLGCLGLAGSWGYTLWAILNGQFTYTTLALAAFVPLVSLFCLGVFSAPIIRRAIR